MILEMSLEGFRQYRSKETIKLCKGLILIQGGNNAGKTTLFYALEYVLFGEVQGFPGLIALKNYSPTINHIEVQIVYIGPDQTKYELSRRHEFQKERVKKPYFILNRVEEDGNKTLIMDSKSVRKEDLQQQITAHFGFSKRMFQVIINNAQGEHRDFLNGDRRLDILFGITASDYLATLFGRTAKDQITQGTRVIKEAEEQQTVLTGNLEEILTEIKEENKKIGEIQDLLQKIKARLNNIMSTQKNTNRMLGAAKSLYDTETEIKNLEKQMGDIKTEKQKFETEHGMIDQITDKMNSIAKICEELQDKITISKKERTSIDNLINTNYAKHGDVTAQLERRQSQSGKTICDYCSNEIDPTKLEIDLKELEKRQEELTELLKIEKQKKKELALQEEELRKELETNKLESKGLSTLRSEHTKIVKRIEKCKEQIKGKTDSLQEIRNQVEIKKNDCLKQRDEILPEIVNAIEKLDTVQPALILWREIGNISSKIDQKLGGLKSERREKRNYLKERQEALMKAQKREEKVRSEIQKWKKKTERAESQKDLGQRFQTISEGFGQFLQEQRTTLKQNLEARIQNWYSLLAAKKDFVQMEVDPTNYHLRVVPSISPNIAPVPASKYSGGGHQMLLALAYKLSLADSLGRPSLLLIDEPTDGTDSENLQSLLDRITALSGIFPQTWMITHHGLAQEEADSIIDVSREGAQSKIKIV